MKTDKGFEFVYWKLSYRRKFIRTAWCLPVVILFSVYLYFEGVPALINIMISLIFFLIWILQLIYNYARYVKEEKNKEKE